LPLMLQANSNVISKRKKNNILYSSWK
jgi:hypothetical protein